MSPSLNDALFKALNGVGGKAVDAVNDFTRAKLREESFYRQIFDPPLGAIFHGLRWEIQREAALSPRARWKEKHRKQRRERRDGPPTVESSLDTAVDVLQTVFSRLEKIEQTYGWGITETL